MAQWFVIGIQALGAIVSAITTLWPIFQGGMPDMGHVGATTALAAMVAHNVMNGRSNAR